MSILVITTGGTIGGLAYPDPRHAPRFVTLPPQGDLLLELAAPLFATHGARGMSFEARDSNFIDDAYRARLLRTAADAPESAVLITHGTDTILVTADYFTAHAGKLNGKPVIFTGAMVPLANGPGHDGHANLEFALQTLAKNPPAGIHVVLSDFDAQGAWQPRLYPHRPGEYEKFFDPEDSRYNRLRKKS